MADSRFPPVLRMVAALCVLATMTIWLEAGYAERLFELGVLALAAAVAVQALAARSAPSPAVPGMLIGAGLLAVACWGPVQLLAGWTVYRYETWVASLRWIARIGVFFVAYHALASAGSHEVRERARAALAAFGAFIGVFATIQAYTSNGEYFWSFSSGQDQVFGPFQNRNNYAAFIELVLPFALWEGLKPGKYRALWLAAAGIMISSVVACASRAGSALVALEIPTVFAAAWFSKRFARRQLSVGAAAIVIAAALSVAVTGWEALERRAVLFDPLPYRREMARSALTMALDRPWTGFGLGTFPTVYPAYATFDSGYFVNHAHNDWAEWASEGGLLFLMLLAALTAAASFAGLRCGWGVGVTAVFLHGWIDFPMQRTGVAVWMFVAGAMLAAEWRARCETE